MNLSFEKEVLDIRLSFLTIIFNLTFLHCWFATSHSCSKSSHSTTDSLQLLKLKSFQNYTWNLLQEFSSQRSGSKFLARFFQTLLCPAVCLMSSGLLSHDNIAQLNWKEKNTGSFMWSGMKSISVIQSDKQSLHLQ